MKYTFFFLILFILSTSFSSQKESQTIDILLNSNVPWKFKTDKQNMLLQFRWLNNSSKQKTRQMRCKTSAEINSTHLISALKSPTINKKYLPRVELCEINECKSESEWYSYIIFDFPWPMAKRDIITKNRIIEDDEFLIVEIIGQENYLPLKPKIERIGGFYGYWKLNKKDNSLEYSIYSNKKSSIPTWVTDPFIEQNLIESVSCLKEILISQNAKPA